jgi:hypothetical protein
MSKDQGDLGQCDVSGLSRERTRDDPGAVEGSKGHEAWILGGSTGGGGGTQYSTR